MPHLALVAMAIVLRSQWAADELGLHHQQVPALQCQEEVQLLLALHMGNTMNGDREKATAMAAELLHVSLVHQVVEMAIAVAGRGKLLAAVVTWTLLDSAQWIEPAQRAGSCVALHAGRYDTLG